MNTNECSDLKEVFTHIYRTDFWANKCGSGSTFEYTEQLIPKLQAIIYRHQIKTLLDAPCGLYTWAKALKVETYIGGDIVEDIYLENKQKNPLVEFKVLDITEDSLPAADLWLCRACLYHLSVDNIRKVIQNFLRSNIPLALFTTSKEHEIEGKNGGYRPFNLRQAPFWFPEPFELFDDGPLMQMGLWSRQQLELK